MSSLPFHFPFPYSRVVCHFTFHNTSYAVDISSLPPIFFLRINCLVSFFWCDALCESCCFSCPEHMVVSAACDLKKRVTSYPFLPSFLPFVSSIHLFQCDVVCASLLFHVRASLEHPQRHVTESSSVMSLSLILLFFGVMRCECRLFHVLTEWQ